MIDFLTAMSKGKHRKGGVARLRSMVAKQEKEQFGGVYCYCCGFSVSANSGTLEHIKPVSLGGKTVLDNLALSHKLCNEIRGNSWTPRSPTFC